MSLSLSPIALDIERLPDFKQLCPVLKELRLDVSEQGNEALFLR